MKTPAFVVRSLESQSAVSPITFQGGEDFDDTRTAAADFAKEQVKGLRKGEGWARVDAGDDSAYDLFTARA